MAKFQKGHIITSEVRRKISLGLKGFKRSPETIERMRSAQKINKSHVSKETGEKIRLAKLGKKASLETRRKMSEAQSGEKSNTWKGGTTPIVLLIRHCFEYRQWVSDCFHRDDFTCQRCHARGGVLNAHHIKSFSKIMSEYKIRSLEEALQCAELWDVINGQTHCKGCHSLINTRNG